MEKRTFKNSYSQIGKKKGFAISRNKEDKTDQSQLCSASIVEMAKRFGIDAIIAKAEKLRIEAEDNLAGKLYGNDLTAMFNSKEEMLNVKKKLNNLFENIPARIRKEYFKDNQMDFINAYTTNDEKKLTILNELGLVSDTQLDKVKKFNAIKKRNSEEMEKRNEFIAALSKVEGSLYENYKKNGTINISNNSSNTANNSSVQTDIQ